MNFALVVNDTKHINEAIEISKQNNVTFVVNDMPINALIELSNIANVKNIKYDNTLYDIAIFYTEECKINAKKRIVIGNKESIDNHIIYLKQFNLDKIINTKLSKDKKFSIIVPNYNNGQWIEKTIESVVNQTYKNWEMYIIDDMSTDNSTEIVQMWTEKDRRIQLIQNEIKLYNGGSRNRGILQAKKSNPNGYLLFIDSDDWLANNEVLDMLNNFIIDEDLITLDYQYYRENKIETAGKCRWKSKDDLFMTVGAMCAVWCKCFKVSIAPLFEFNTLMEDRNYHYRLVNRCNNISNLGQVTHTWNKMNTKSITTDRKQKYNSNLQGNIEWDNCCYRHIAGMKDLLNELDNPIYIEFIKDKIKVCLEKARNGVYQQL